MFITDGLKNVKKLFSKVLDTTVNMGYTNGKLFNYINNFLGGKWMMRETFAERLADLLKQQGVSQKELAERVGVTEATMSRYMHSERIPKSEIIANIATALHTTSDYLLGTEKDGDIETDYPRIVRLIARNAASMTKEQKSAIINALIEED